jgi:hypothetical protein
MSLVNKLQTESSDDDSFNDEDAILDGAEDLEDEASDLEDEDTETEEEDSVSSDSDYSDTEDESEDDTYVVSPTQKSAKMTDKEYVEQISASELYSNITQASKNSLNAPIAKMFEQFERKNVASSFVPSIENFSNIIIRKQTETDNDYQARLYLALMFCEFKNGLLNPVCAAVLSNMYMEKARNGVQYTAEVERVLRGLSEVLEEHKNQQREQREKQDLTDLKQPTVKKPRARKN